MKKNQKLSWDLRCSCIGSWAAGLKKKYIKTLLRCC